MVVRTSKGVRRGWIADPVRRNAAVLLTNKMQPVGTRIFGPVTRELRTESSCGSSRSRPKCCERGREHEKIKKGDEVVVIAGRDKGQRGEVLRVLIDDRRGGRGHQRREEAPRGNPKAGQRRRHHREGSPLHISNVASTTRSTKQGRSRGNPGLRRRQEGPLSSSRTAKWSTSERRRSMARLQQQYRENRAELDRAVRLRERRWRCRGSRSHAEHGRRRGRRRQEDHGCTPSTT